MPIIAAIAVAAMIPMSYIVFGLSSLKENAPPHMLKGQMQSVPAVKSLALANRVPNVKLIW
jgi:hypothetical protein